MYVTQKKLLHVKTLLHVPFPEFRCMLSSLAAATNNKSDSCPQRSVEQQGGQIGESDLEKNMPLYGVLVG